MTRKTWALLVIASLMVLFGYVGRSGAADDPPPCTIATKGDSPVAKACKKGGRKEAGKTMKAIVKAAKAKGTVYKCDHCHVDLDDFALTDDAKDDFKKLLDAIEGGKPAKPAKYLSLPFQPEVNP